MSLSHSDSKGNDKHVAVRILKPHQVFFTVIKFQRIHCTEFIFHFLPEKYVNIQLVPLILLQSPAGNVGFSPAIKILYNYNITKSFGNFTVFFLST